MAAIDQSLAEAALLGAERIEVDARGVLIKPGRDLVLGLFDRIAVDVIDLLAYRVVLETIFAASERESWPGTSSAGQASPSTFGSTAVGSRGT